MSQKGICYQIDDLLILVYLHSVVLFATGSHIYICVYMYMCMYSICVYICVYTCICIYVYILCLVSSEAPYDGI